MGQDGEEAAEMIATIRGEHVEMKQWYAGPSPHAEAVRTKYGPYPALWKEVLNWPGWKESRKAYLQFQQTKDNPAAAAAAAVPRKRRSRWGNSDEPQEQQQQPAPSKPRRSRWGRDEAPGPLPPPPPPRPPMALLPGLPAGLLPGMPSNLPPQQQEKMKNLQGRLRTINHRLNNLEGEAARIDALPRDHRERSPSPPPVYGADGKRRNTRAVRWRERYSVERHDVLEEIMGMDPNNRQSGMLRRKRSKKIPIPIEQHPTYNFIGLIIGPRGKTQKELESKTGCKIAIRGRGSVKEGARGRRDGRMMEGDDEPLHVVVTGEDQRSVDAATDMVQQMLVVIDDESNMHKQQQLRELALLNGTLKEDEYCNVCGEKGHRAFECPKRFSMNKNTVTVKCAICGDTSHPTRDCTQKPTEQKDAGQLDSEYMSFMAELDGKKVDNAAPTGTKGLDAAPAATNSGVTIIKSVDGTRPAVALSSKNIDSNSSGVTIIKPAGSSTSAASSSGITIIKPAGGSTSAVSSSGITIIKPATMGGSIAPPPPPFQSLPPPPIAESGLPPSLPPSFPPPSGGTNGVGGAPSMSLPPPLPVPVAGHNLPPPPTNLPPPPMGGGNAYAPPPQHAGGYKNNNNNTNYGNQAGGGQQQHGYNNQYGQPPSHQQHHSHQQQGQYHSHQQQGQQQGQQQQGQQQQGQQQQGQQDETAAWDHRSYYGQGGTGGDAGGAGGFNWWD